MNRHRVGSLLLLAAVLGACVGAPSGSTAGGGTPWPIPEDPGARRWGDGPYGLVLVTDAGHDVGDWDGPAATFAAEGMSVVAVAPGGTAQRLTGAILALQDAGVERVAVLGAGSGTVPALELGATHPELIDQLIVLSATGSVAELDVFPKLFVASEDEAAASDAERMAAEAPGDWNALYLAPGGETGQAILAGEGAAGTMEAILVRLEERR
jgi:hypothetical protein